MKHPLNQKAMLLHYQQVYEEYNAQCERLSQRNRGGVYATGYRCLINFCKAYHEERTKGFAFESSYALLAQDWGLSQSPKTIKRHLLRLSDRAITLKSSSGVGERLGFPLFSQLQEVQRGKYLNVKIFLHPFFIVYRHEGLQELHSRQYGLGYGC